MPRSGKKEIPVEELAPLLESKRGNIAAVAREFRVARSTILSRVNESPTLRKILDEARESMLDNAESMLYSKVLAGSTVELLFFLKTQGRSRGYIEKVEQENSGEIILKVKYGEDGTHDSSA